MSSIKTSQLHDLTRERLVGSRSEHELIGLILSLKDTVLNQRRDLARVQRDYDEKKMQYEAVRDKLEWLSNGNHIYRIDERPEQDVPTFSRWGWGDSLSSALRVNGHYETREQAEHALRFRDDFSRENNIYRIDVTEVEPEPSWWMVEYNMKDQAFTYAKPSTATLTGSILSIDHTLDRLLWRNTAHNEGDAKAKAVAAWEQAFGVEV